LRAAGVLTNDIRDGAIAAELLAASEDVQRAGLKPEDECTLLLAQAQFQYHSANLAAAKALLDQAFVIAETTRIRDSRAMTIYAGLGLTYCAAGEYELSLEYYLRAYRLCMALDQAQGAAVAATNVALCHGRLGRYEDQFQWAQKALRAGTRIAGGNLAHSAYNAGFAAAMLGRTNDARSAIDQARSRATEMPAWMKQAWHLYAADIYLLLGQRREAVMEATAGIEHELQCRANAGRYVRWATAISTHNRESPLVLAERLAVILEQIDSYDSLDQVECLIATDHIERLRGRHSTERTDAIHRRLSRLPSAVASQLRALQYSTSR
jgi:tetratricopeptide (TPR) repeat protein